jgi:SAM-dependent methyltransferase
VAAAAVIGRVRALLEAPAGGRARIAQELLVAGRTVPREVVERELGSPCTEDLIALGLARWTPDGLQSVLRVTRFRGTTIASDRSAFRHHPSFVMGPAPSTGLLADAIGPVESGRVLDLGCGPGTLALWLATGGVEALGIDINHRALAFAEFNRELNLRSGVAFEAGDFLTRPADPRLDEAFDVVLANPPFVPTPSTVLVYRDRPLPGHETTRVAVERAGRALAPGGRGYVLGTWIDDAQGPWDRPPREWLRRAGLRAVVTRVSSIPPLAYAEHWTRELGEPARTSAIADWTAALGREGARRITTGVIAIARPARRSWSARLGVTRIDQPQPDHRAIEAALAG